MMKMNSNHQTGKPTIRVSHLVTVLLGATVCFSHFATSAAATTDSTFNAQALCALLPDNTKIKDPNACNAWILCQNGQPINGTCAADEFYDRNTQECVPEGSITCISSNPCAAEPGINGFFPDPFTCNYYYYCNNGVGTVGECREGYNFNPGTQDCIRNYKCVPKINPYNYCNIVPDNVFIKNASNCFDYSQCWNNQLVEGSCPKGFYFDPQSSNCVYPQDYACPQAPPPPPENVQQSCTEPGTFVSDQRTCNGYYYCDQHPNGEYELIPGECPSGRFFSATNGGECVPRTAIYCPYDRCAGFGFNGIKLANIANDNCIGYDICQNGQTIGTGQCPDGEYFNEVTQYCVTQAVTYTACEAASTDTTPDTDSTDTTVPTVSET